MHLLYSLVCQTRWAAKVSSFVLAIAILGVATHAEQPKSRGEEFRAFYVEFVAAARTNDKNKLADLIAFPVEDWSVEKKGIVETIGINDKSDFLARYDLLFTP